MLNLYESQLLSHKPKSHNESQQQLALLPKIAATPKINDVKLVLASNNLNIEISYSVSALLAPFRFVLISSFVVT